MGRMSALWNLMKQGHAVANPEAWKKGQVTVSALAIALLAIVEALRAFGLIDLPLSTEDAALIAGGLLALVNLILSVARSERMGLPNRGASAPQAGGGPVDDNRPESGA